MSKQMKRSEIREIAFQSLFPLNFNTTLTKEDAVQAVYELDHTEWLTDDQLQFTPQYLDILIDGVLAKQTELDEMIKSHLSKNWHLGRIAKTDLIILRIALFEFMYVDNQDVPNVVALNEALELAKKYADDTSRKFINGVLSSVLTEINADSAANVAVEKSADDGQNPAAPSENE